MPEEQIGQVNQILEGRDSQKGLIVYVDTNEFWSSGYDAGAVIARLKEETGYANARKLYTHELSETYILE